MRFDRMSGLDEEQLSELEYCVVRTAQLVFRTFVILVSRCGWALSAAIFGIRVEDEGVIDPFFGGAGLEAEGGRQFGLGVLAGAGPVDADGPAVG